jgi:myo-inositol-1(or 4)-monophosphatase
MVLEAGGRVTGSKGEPFSIHQPSIVATNGLIHEEMLAVLSQA